jgi:nitrite reductase/ring-hydroxylating ferredoxin subunit
MTIDHPTFPIPAAYPAELQAPGTTDAADIATLDAGLVADLPEGSMRRATRGDLDVLVAHTPAGLVAVDDRCPHMSAPLSIGELDGCVVGCPLHEGRFDLCSGDVVQMPTTGGLDADDRYHPTWSPAGREPKVDPPGKKAEARRFTRVRRLRYYPLRIAEGRILVTVPAMGGDGGEDQAGAVGGNGAAS